jgi:hypothetical protein
MVREFREFERVSTAGINVTPMRSRLDGLTRAFHDARVSTQPDMMRVSVGSVTFERSLSPAAPSKDARVGPCLLTASRFNSGSNRRNEARTLNG